MTPPFEKAIGAVLPHFPADFSFAFTHRTELADAEDGTILRVRGDGAFTFARTRDAQDLPGNTGVFEGLLPATIVEDVAKAMARVRWNDLKSTKLPGQAVGKVEVTANGRTVQADADALRDFGDAGKQVSRALEAIEREVAKHPAAALALSLLADGRELVATLRNRGQRPVLVPNPNMQPADAPEHRFVLRAFREGQPREDTPLAVGAPFDTGARYVRLDPGEALQARTSAPTDPSIVAAMAWISGYDRQPGDRLAGVDVSCASLGTVRWAPTPAMEPQRPPAPTTTAPPAPAPPPGAPPPRAPPLPGTVRASGPTTGAAAVERALTELVSTSRWQDFAAEIDLFDHAWARRRIEVSGTGKVRVSFTGAPGLDDPHLRQVGVFEGTVPVEIVQAVAEAVRVAKPFDGRVTAGVSALRVAAGRVACAGPMPTGSSAALVPLFEAAAMRATRPLAALALSAKFRREPGLWMFVVRLAVEGERRVVIDTPSMHLRRQHLHVEQAGRSLPVRTRDEPRTLVLEPGGCVEETFEVPMTASKEPLRIRITVPSPELDSAFAGYAAPIGKLTSEWMAI